MAYLYSKNKDNLLLRLKKIEGQVRGVQRMINDDRYCVDILQQLSAVSSALNQVALSLLQDHIQGCVAKAIGEPREQEAIKELIQVVNKFIGSRSLVNPANLLRGEQNG